MTRVQKLQYDINREEAKILILSSDEIHKYEYLAGEEILPSGLSQVLEQPNFIYFGKTFQELIKIIRNQREKQIRDIEEHGK